MDFAGPVTSIFGSLFGKKGKTGTDPVAVYQKHWQNWYDYDAAIHNLSEGIHPLYGALQGRPDELPLRAKLDTKYNELRTTLMQTRGSTPGAAGVPALPFEPVGELQRYFASILPSSPAARAAQGETAAAQSAAAGSGLDSQRLSGFPFGWPMPMSAPGSESTPWGLVALVVAVVIGGVYLLKKRRR